MKATDTDSEKLRTANGWAWEAQWAARVWREEAWRNCEIMDGGESAWTQENWQRALDAGIDPITVGRAFPVINMLRGAQVVNRFDITAKARTQHDGNIAQTMTECVKFVSDQCEGDFQITAAFGDQIVPGVGWIAPSLNSDPRQEKVTWRWRNWKEVWWDPYSSPWISPDRTRYAMWQRWMDIEALQEMLPKMRKEIDQAYNEMSGQHREHGYSSLQDEAQQVEENIRTLAASDWIDPHRRRVRPIEMYYTVNETCLFAIFSDGQAFEIYQDMDPREAFHIISQSQHVARATVKKMRIMTFLGENLLLQDVKSPFTHDQFPLVPFVGYLDRWGFPYGVIQQIRGQVEEVDKRRSMALAMLQKRRVIAEKGVVPDGDEDALDNLYEEANKLDGFLVLQDGGLNKFKLDEMIDLAGPQVELMRQSESEINEVSGAIGRVGPWESNQSGEAKKQDIMRSQVSTATLMDNLRRSMRILGYQTGSNIQQFWKHEKVLRVTDRLTGAERFVTVNERIPGTSEIKNNITQGRYDWIVTEAPHDDTIREKNMDLLYAAIEKSPPEAAPTLLVAAFEMSDLPNKEILIEKLKPVLGLDPSDEDEDPEQTKAKIMQELQAQKEQAAIQAQLEQEAIRQELLNKKLENAKKEAEIKKIEAETNKTYVDTEIAAEEHDIDVAKEHVEAFDRGLDISDRLTGNDKKQEERASA